MAAQSSFMAGISEAYLADLGRVVAAWAHVEHSFLIHFLRDVAMHHASSKSLKDPFVVELMGRSFSTIASIPKAPF